MPLPEYKSMCAFYGQTSFPDLPVAPGASSTTRQTGEPTNTALPSEGENGGSGSTHSSLSSGAIAGMYVLFLCSYLKLKRIFSLLKPNRIAYICLTHSSYCCTNNYRVVSAVALIVALSVAGYVYNRRKRELAKQKEEEDLYKFQENSRASYMEAPLPQYTGMIQSSLPSLPQLTYVSFYADIVISALDNSIVELLANFYCLALFSYELATCES
jgi:hypothetical protein